MSTATSKDGTIIAFDRSGVGPPIILVHPAYGHRSFDPAMAEVARLLSTQFTVFSYDRRVEARAATRRLTQSSAKLKTSTPSLL